VRSVAVSGLGGLLDEVDSRLAHAAPDRRDDGVGRRHDAGVLGERLLPLLLDLLPRLVTGTPRRVEIVGEDEDAAKHVALRPPRIEALDERRLVRPQETEPAGEARGVRGVLDRDQMPEHTDARVEGVFASGSLVEPDLPLDDPRDSPDPRGPGRRSSHESTVLSTPRTGSGDATATGGAATSGPATVTNNSAVTQQSTQHQNVTQKSWKDWWADNSTTTTTTNSHNQANGNTTHGSAVNGQGNTGNTVKRSSRRSYLPLV